MQLTRKRTERSVERALTQSCPTCAGLGRVKSPETVCLDIRRALLRASVGSEATELTVRAHPDVTRLLGGELRGILAELRERHGLGVRVFEAGEFHPTRFEVTA